MAREENSSWHEPVLAEAITQLLITDRAGAYLDLTAGGGGHLKALARQLEPTARLYGVDRDPAAVERASRQLEEAPQFRRVIQASFGDLTTLASSFGESRFSGILLDLGISSYQIDTPARGFSFRLDGPLDMRMNPSAAQSAADLIASLDERALADIIWRYGEERLATRIARAIVRERQKTMILTTAQLADVVRAVVPAHHVVKSLARVFQALRIAVNEELEQLRTVLPAAAGMLSQGGRLAVIAYHSLEDRLVKQYFAAEARGRCTCPADLPVCVCGAVPTMRLITRKAMTPSADEERRNPRSRSAKLRVAEVL